MTWEKAERIYRTLVHAAFMAGAIWIAANPEYAMFAPVLQYLGSQIDAAR
jgi:hypothetical protein